MTQLNNFGCETQNEKLKCETESQFRGSQTDLDPAIIKTIVTLLTHIALQNKDVTMDPFVNAADAVYGTPWAYDWATMTEYIDRLKEWISCGPESYVVAMCLLKRLEGLSALSILTQRSVHRVFFTLLVLAVKVTEDETLCNQDFAKVGCVSPRELFYMELHALKALQFGCFVHPEEFAVCREELQKIDLLVRKNQLLFVRSAAAPLLFSDIVKQLNPGPESPTHRFSIFSLRRKTSRSSLSTITSRHATGAVAKSSRHSVCTPPSVSTEHKTVESNSSKPITSANQPVIVTRRASASMLPRHATPKSSRATRQVCTPKQPAATLKSSTPIPKTSTPKQILKSVSLFASIRRKYPASEAGKSAGHTPKQSNVAINTNTPSRATPRLFFRQDSI